LLTPSGGVPVLVLGVDPAADGDVREYHLESGQPLGDGPGFLLSGPFARTQGLEVGGTVRLITATGISKLSVTGLLEPRGAAAFVPLPTAQRLYGLKGKVNSVQVVLADGADPDQVRQRLQERLPEGLTVQTPAARGDLAQDSLRSSEQGLGVLSLVSLVAG